MSTPPAAASPAETPERLAFYERIGQKHMTRCGGRSRNSSHPNRSAAASIAAFIQLLPKGLQTARYRSTDGTIFVAVEGHGRTRIGTDFVVEWRPRDIFVVPSWKPVVHEAADEAVLFSFSDRPVQEALQLFREERHRA